jgi:hemerythrin superfamily protein
MRLSLITVIIVLVTTSLFAGEKYPYTWENTRSRYVLSAAEKAKSELVLKNHIEYGYGFENDQFIMHSVIHRIILVNNAEAIQKNNRITISMRRTIELVTLKARVITPSGKVITFDEKNLKELKDEESGNAFRIFAMEGVEAGSEVEYFFVRKMYSALYDSDYLQSNVPIKNSSFTLRCPKHLKFDFKTYFGYPDVKSETTETENIYKTSMTDVPAAREEEFSNYDATRKRIEFKLAYNMASSGARLYTWDDAAKAFYKVISAADKDEEKALEKFSKSLKDDRSKSNDERILNLEQQIKTLIQINEESNDKNLTNIANIIKYKIASPEGITKLMYQVFAKFSLSPNIVLTCSRAVAQFDGAFDSWSFLDEYLLYFPETKKFLSPYSPETRYPLVPAKFTSQKGLFIEPVTVGSVTSALATVNDIPALPYTSNMDNLDITVDFNQDLTGNTIDLTRTMGGYNGGYFTSYLPLMTEEQKQKMAEELTKQTAPDPTISSWSAKANSNLNGGEFVMKVNFTSSHFIEKAGPRILFKAGLLIGPQTELYSEEKRVNGVENDFNRGYDRVIKIKVPAGYKVKNASDLKFNVIYKDGDTTPFLFKSDFAQDGDVLTITINEYYKSIYAPLSRYEDYRSVINAAADFNKVTLVLEKAK